MNLPYFACGVAVGLLAIQGVAVSKMQTTGLRSPVDAGVAQSTPPIPERVDAGEPSVMDRRPEFKKTMERLSKRIAIEDAKPNTLRISFPIVLRKDHDAAFVQFVQEDKATGYFFIWDKGEWHMFPEDFEVQK